MLLIDRPAIRTPTTAASSDSGIASRVNRPGPQVRQEQERHQDHQQRAVAQRAVQVRQRQLDEVRLAEQPRVELHARRQRRLDAVEHPVELGGQRERVDVRLPVDAENHRRLSVAGALAPLERLPHPHVRDVPHPGSDGCRGSRSPSRRCPRRRARGRPPGSGTPDRRRGGTRPTYCGWRAAAQLPPRSGERRRPPAAPAEPAPRTAAARRRSPSPARRPASPAPAGGPASPPSCATPAGCARTTAGRRT